jgi:hypothetical protein
MIEPIFIRTKNKKLDFFKSEAHTYAMKALLAKAILTFTIFVGVFFCPIRANAVWFAGSGPDYSQGASSEFYCASTGTFTTQAGASATTPVISLYNPPGSGKNLVILDVGIDVNASPAAAAQFMLAFSTAVAPSTTTIALANGIVTSAQIGKSTTTAVGICLLDSTLANANTPKAFRYLGGTTGASAIGGVSLTDQTQGKVVVPPGFVVTLQAISAASVTADLLWREDPGN